MNNLKTYSTIAAVFLLPVAFFLVTGNESCQKITGFEDLDLRPVEASYIESNNSAIVKLRNYGTKNVTVEPLDIKLAESNRRSDVLMNGAREKIRNGTTEKIYLNHLAEIRSAEKCNTFEMEIQYDKGIKANFQGRGTVQMKAEIAG